MSVVGVLVEEKRTARARTAARTARQVRLIEQSSTSGYDTHRVRPTRPVVFSSTALFLFFFSSRRRHTRSTRDWSSDVCSSDLVGGSGVLAVVVCALYLADRAADADEVSYRLVGNARSEERRVGKECRCRWLAY